jgi:hypothetical protein
MRRCFALSVLTALAVLVVPASALAANTYVVTRQDDPAPAGGQGSCAAAGPCSLRQAVNTANANAGADTITLPAGDYQRSLGEFFITESLTLAGAGARTTIIHGASNSRGLIITQPGTYEVRDVTITGGGAGAFGGGISNNQGALTVRRVAIVGNRVTAFCVGVMPPTAVSSTGGGIASGTGAVTVIDSLIAGNFADGSGACANANGFGAGIQLAAPLTVINSTITGNVAGTGAAGAGGGISENLGGAVTVTLKNSTVAGNTAVGGVGGGNIQMPTSAATLAPTGSIIAGGSGAAGFENCSRNGAATSSGGGNVEDRDQCGLGAGDRRNADPQLGTLQDNGGPTDTRAIASTSPALDFAGACGLAADQRGISRPQGAACDSGAFELVPASSSGGSTGGGGSTAGSTGGSTGAGAGAGAGGGTIGPACQITVAGNTSGLLARVSCDRAASATLGGDVVLTTKRKRKRARRAATKTVALAAKSAQIAPGTPFTLKLALPRSVVSAVKRGARAVAHLSLVASAGGAQTQVTSTFKIKAAKKKKKRHRR